MSGIYEPIFRLVRKIAKSECYFRRVGLSARNNSAPTGRIFVKFGIGIFIENFTGVCPCIVVIWEEENQLDATQCFIELVICSTCFGHLYAHHQELANIKLV